MLHHAVSSSEMTNKHTMSTQELKSNLSELKSSMSEMKSSLSSHLVSAAAAAAASNPTSKFASAGLIRGTHFTKCQSKNKISNKNKAIPIMRTFLGRIA